MTGRTTARAAGGSELAVAWVELSTTTVIPFVFEPGMTWSEYVRSGYRLYSLNDSTLNRFGLTISGTSAGIYNCDRDLKLLTKTDGTTIHSSTQIEPNYTYKAKM